MNNTTEEKVTNDASFSKMGRTYQERVLQAVFQDHEYADTVADVLDPKYFDLKHLETIARRFFEHRARYKTFPSIEAVEIMVESDEKVPEATKRATHEFAQQAAAHPLNGDARYYQESSLEFCRKQSVLEAMQVCLDRVQTQDYDSIQKILRDALEKGSPRDTGHDYLEQGELRAQKSVRAPLSTGWPVVDRVLNGGWERGTLSTFIAPTGAGKSMFHVNVGASALEQGLNVLYCTLEMADFKIGLRFDSYFSGVKINDIPGSKDREAIDGPIRQKVHGRLFIKEWPTKRASVQTIRSHVQRLQAVKGFFPDIIILDYADLLKGARGYGEKRYELEGVYEDLRCLAQELNVVMITADQTNRAGLDLEVVSIANIGEAYAKATVCDLIMTISRTPEDKINGTGRLFVAKSRLGPDGMVFNFLLDTATVRARVLDQTVNVHEAAMDNQKVREDRLRSRFEILKGSLPASGSTK